MLDIPASPLKSASAVVLALLAGAWPAPAGAGPVVDVRVLIDVSGSMKQSDPKRLRGPALRLLTELLPPGSRAGVWTFGQYVNMQVPLAVVDKAWKEKARAESRRIHSHGLFTNIEDALRRATWDWRRPDPRYRRSLILLSDGKVDIARDASRNAASRGRIENEILPRLKRAGVALHTIALSDEADHQLMQRLAVATDGWYQRARTSAGLQRVFLHLFEKAARKPSLPLTDNRFKVDPSVKDITVIAFHRPGAPATRLITPSGEAHSKAKKSANVSWFSDVGVDVVTVNEPAPGQWAIDAALDPDNRVLVVTDLRLVVDDLPNNLLAGESLTLKARLQQRQGPVTARDLLQRVRMELAAPGNGGDPLPLRDDGRAPDEARSDGVYTLLWSSNAEEGRRELVVRAVGPTFERQYRQTLRVIGRPLSATVDKDSLAAKQQFRLVLKPREGLVDYRIEDLRITGPASPNTPYPVSRTAEGWEARLDFALAGRGIGIRVRGKKPGGAAFSASWSLVLPPVEIPPAPPPATEEIAAVAEADVAEEALRWSLVAALVVALNCVLGLLSVGGVLLWLRRRRHRVSAAESELVYE